MTSNEYISQALENYKQPIESLRDSPYSISNYKVEKPWGSEQWVDLNESYCVKLIRMNKGNQSSLQLHEFKYEINYVIEGQIKLLIGPTADSLEERLIQAGEGWIVPPNTVHRVIAITDYLAMETSTPHLDDVIRLQDDSNRPSGIIKEEHANN